MVADSVPVALPGAAQRGPSFLPLRAASHHPLLLKTVVLVIDIVGIVLAMWLAFHLMPAPGPLAESGAAEAHVVLGALSLPAWAVVFFRYRLYSSNHIASRRDELVRLAQAVFVAVVIMGSISFMIGLDVNRAWLPFTFATALVVLAGLRELVRQVLYFLRRRGRLVRRVVIVGGNQDAVAFCASLKTQPALGYEVVGFVDDHASHDLIEGVRLLGPTETAREAIVATGARGVIIVSSAVGTEVSNRVLRELNNAGIRVELLPSLVGVSAGRLGLRTLGRFPMVHVMAVSYRGWRAVAKRSFDLVVAGLGLIVAAPVMTLVAVAIKLESPGPVLFRQRRVGRRGEPFYMLKFRSMVQNAEEQSEVLIDLNEADGPLFKIRRDPRITRVGRALRRFSLDELPQLWNVVKGEMAMVGPRPALPNEVTGWSPELHERLKVKPGVTGLWQVSGRSQASFSDYTMLDLYYVDNWSLLTDLAILARTIPVVLSGKGAY